MGFGHAIQQRMDELRKRGADVPKIIMKAQETATLHAVQKAVDMTSSTVGNSKQELSGTNTRNSGMKGSWETDSVTKPKVEAGKYTTILANNKQYASYVNDGHRMDMHFVPGLIINPHSGLLEKVPREYGGIMVGTKTKFVKGLYMRQTAETTYRRVLEEELDKNVKELLL